MTIATTSTDRRRILVIGDAVTPTGFARVLHSILDRLSHKYDVHHLGINYLGDPHDSSWKIYPAGLLGDGLGFNRLVPLAKSLNQSSSSWSAIPGC